MPVDKDGAVPFHTPSGRALERTSLLRAKRANFYTAKGSFSENTFPLAALGFAIRIRI